jgi:hypothetical protein
MRSGCDTGSLRGNGLANGGADCAVENDGHFYLLRFVGVARCCIHECNVRHQNPKTNTPQTNGWFSQTNGK